MTNTVIYNDGELELKISLEEETIWLNANDIASIFDVNRPAIVKHIRNIYKIKELDENATCSIMEQVAKDGKRRKINFYNLDMVLSVGYRVNSIKATKFRQWTTTVLKSYIQNGYTINSERITNERFYTLERDVELIKRKIETVSKGVEEGTLKMKQGLFFNGEIFDAYSFVADLIQSAKDSIVLIDNYIDHSVLTLLSKNKNIEVIILTASISKELKQDIEKYNAQYNNLIVKTTKKYHDRFMIIDNKRIYHIGASLKDLGKKVFAFSKMEIDIHKFLEDL